MLSVTYIKFVFLEMGSSGAVDDGGAVVCRLDFALISDFFAVGDSCLGVAHGVFQVRCLGTRVPGALQPLSGFSGNVLLSPFWRRASKEYRVTD